MSSLTSFIFRQGKQIVAIGRNYAEHAKELNNKVPKEPFFFLKPTSSYVFNGGNVEIPDGIVAHHEVELGVVIGKTGRDVSQADAESLIAGYALAVDMTARNLQDQVKKRGLPWSAAKGFDTFTPIGKDANSWSWNSEFIAKSAIQDPHNLNLALKINGVVKQDGNTSDMIFQIPQLIEHITSIMTLAPGDVILTGTPSGVGPVAAGDKIECTMSDPASGKILSTLNLLAIDRKGGYKFTPE
ncbi:hypothetical protein PLEOSDRAFT_1080466 [Pleurotus ostreatus PC15]|uniref:Fumarylacetoacetase-like C-terminal domain-containing protein n=1 Tax=Pleurotus ostreatus (strain PC15) TaxID=1137138 RepID=A0A067PB05_PLEO1|nr:hypothetical protein PLEOSDRAFT_1080466 [Pleurotus ostreatus PC15]